MSPAPNDNYGRPVETGTTVRNDNSGMGIILGVLLVVVIAIGAYYFINRENAVNNAQTATTEAPASSMAPAAGDATTTTTTTTPAPEASPAPAPADGSAE